MAPGSGIPVPAGVADTVGVGTESFAHAFFRHRPRERAVSYDPGFPDPRNLSRTVGDPLEIGKDIMETTDIVSNELRVPPGVSNRFKESK